MSSCVTVRDVDAAKFVAAYAEVLKNNDKFIVPKWVEVVKTGVHKELAPYDPDWYFIRAAAIARAVYLKPGSGVGSLKVKFGSSGRKSSKGDHHRNAAGGIIRNCLMTLDELKITEPTANGGRKITRVGQQALDLIAGQIARNEL
eukprot:TRINITY_DN103781_c0_g1_i1.p1 TRINITY_DN103781_c0_g1~~TRINITY_DN103781_c0_g1_i1.p1  ORF type:complete len:145 (+),score=8.25 TRINITY_DN103781_c0_g1_i1:21-455(+)